ncbi:gliding motility-associated C-terminal domain-containing protein [Terrimonas pollutisoli]|uniref:T9SS type B sorting domain-containing protein n=1 Tax=Terrimonas pollutisoli TaxID=3034147 RepID=UPI0023ED5005|nr:gliding motility-associated C-terminal domain-containing protein [Terrimonas sp. H1YJ31]
MRIFLSIFFFVVFSFVAKADHITGGEMYYSYTDFSNGKNNYYVTLKLFMRCNSGRQFPDPAIISVFDLGTNLRIQDVSVEQLSQLTIEITNHDPCITDPPRVCYEVAYYRTTISLPPNNSGYLLASQVNYRINGISNLDGSTQVGATYTSQIAGSQPQSNGYVNNSAFFTGSDLVEVCAGNYFSYSFAAKDADNDVLRYSFCAAYRSSAPGVNGVPSGDPPYKPVPYRSPDYLETSPLGKKVFINESTGLITGIAPPQGVYVVTVCVDEIRNGTVIATQRKDLQISVADCSVAAALLDDDYMVCGDTRNLSVKNNSTSPLINTYDWTVFNPAGNSIYTSKEKILNYSFATNGKYSIELIVNRGAPCSDTTTAPVFVYPGLAADFSFTGICNNNPTLFSDRTTLITGLVNSWKWDFGELSTTADVSIEQNASFTYPSHGAKLAQLIVTTTEGCRDTATQLVQVIDKPPLTVAFSDTLICINDQVQLQATGTGNFSWSPAFHITNANSPGPLVSPPVNTTYYVNLETEGCVNTDSVLVLVTDHVNLQVMRDTIICSGDTIQLRVVSDGLSYAWSPAGQLIDPFAKNPFAITTATTQYQVTAFIGGCSATQGILVTSVPYPIANAGKDTVICYATTANLQAITNGNSWQWLPSSHLSNPSLLNPTTTLIQTTTYIFKAYDSGGCPKPGIDTVVITVLPKIIVSAGNDTAIVVGQPLQLNASGADNYFWSPAYNLSSTTIANPVAVYSEPSGGLRYKVEAFNIAGCVDSAFVMIKIFATKPTVFVPTAFTPNHDGKNDILRPILAGMRQFDYFQVYNRWGQLVFSTSRDGHGWDGTINGQPQANNTYVWMVKATDYTGAPYFKKGTVTLIR